MAVSAGPSVTILRLSGLVEHVSQYLEPLVKCEIVQTLFLFFIVMSSLTSTAYVLTTTSLPIWAPFPMSLLHHHLFHMFFRVRDDPTVVRPQNLADLMTCTEISIKMDAHRFLLPAMFHSANLSQLVGAWMVPKRMHFVSRNLLSTFSKAACPSNLSMSKNAVIHPWASFLPKIFAMRLGLAKSEVVSISMLATYYVGTFLVTLPIFSVCLPAIPNPSAKAASSSPRNAGNRFREPLQRAPVSNLQVAYHFDVTDVSAIAL